MCLDGGVCRGMGIPRRLFQEFGISELLNYPANPRRIDFFRHDFDLVVEVLAVTITAVWQEISQDER